MAGVYLKRKGVYGAQCNKGKGRRAHIGYYKSEEEAHKAYLGFKASVILDRADEQNDKRISHALISRANYLLEKRDSI